MLKRAGNKVLGLVYKSICIMQFVQMDQSLQNPGSCKCRLMNQSAAKQPEISVAPDCDCLFFNTFRLLNENIIKEQRGAPGCNLATSCSFP